MAVYDLEEQEHLDDLKAWWKHYGNAGHGRRRRSRASSIGGVQGWRWWQASQAARRRVLYSAVSKARAQERRGQGARTR